MNTLTQAGIVEIETEIKILQDCLRIIAETKEKYEELDKYKDNSLIKEFGKFNSLDFCFLMHDKIFHLSHAMYDRQELLKGTESPYKTVEVVEYQAGDDLEWDAEWEHISSFYSDSTDDCETPDFVTSKVTGEVFCTLEGYARLSRLPVQTIFKRTYVINGCKRFNMQEILIQVYDCDDEVNIIPLTEVAKWIVDDNPQVAKLLMGDDNVILPANFISQIRNQKTLDTKPQSKLIPKARSIPPIKSIPVKSKPVSSNKSVEGNIYLIGNRENNTLKIGFSENSVRTRLAAFQVSCAHRLEILKTKKGTKQQEKELLERFKEFKISREWFIWNDLIIENF